MIRKKHFGKTFYWETSKVILPIDKDLNYIRSNETDYMNYLGFVFKNSKFKFGKTFKEDFENNKEILMDMESKLLKNFPENSLKRFILDNI